MIQRAVLKISTAVHEGIYFSLDAMRSRSDAVYSGLPSTGNCSAKINTYISFSSEYLPDNFRGATEFTDAGEQALGAVWI